VDSVVIPRTKRWVEGDSPILRIRKIGTVPERAVLSTYESNPSRDHFSAVSPNVWLLGER